VLAALALALAAGLWVGRFFGRRGFICGIGGGGFFLGVGAGAVGRVRWGVLVWALAGPPPAPRPPPRPALPGAAPARVARRAGAGGGWWAGCRAPSGPGQLSGWPWRSW